MWIVLFVYTAVMAWAGFLFLRIRRPVLRSHGSRSISVSVIIPVRNESAGIAELIADLIPQIAALENAEVVIVNDHSEDRTAEIVSHAIAGHTQFRLIHLESEKGKKSALRKGISMTSGELIISLDGDVRLGPDWLNVVLSFYASNKSKLIILPVMFSRTQAMWSRLLMPEMLGLQAITAGSAAGGNALLCNGANLCFQRVLWQRAQGEMKSGVSSGDDMFLLDAVRRNGWGPVHWLHDPRAIACTPAPESFSELISQRIRWSSKWKLMSNPMLLFLTGLVGLVNLAALIMQVFAVTDIFPWSALLWWTALFTGAQLCVVLPAALWYRRLADLWVVPLLAFIYPWYALLVALAGWIIRPRWKGRAISLQEKRLPG
jgi:cellulose synthase/poly-beta-1,6-N-acetylglucosamine synthase-like glycosyltransferase